MLKILALDIETAPHIAYVWGLWSQNIATNQIQQPGYTLCWAAKWIGDVGVKHGSLWADGKEEMLRKLVTLLDEADAVVHYNGNKFDIPRLNTEFLSVGIPPYAPFKPIDLYPIVRKQFAFASNKLDYVCQALGIGKKVKHRGMDMWRDVMNGDAKSQEQMMVYNIQDVVLLEDLYFHILPWIVNHPNHGLYVDTEMYVCPNCGSLHVEKRGFYHAKTQVYQKMRCLDCGKWSRYRTTILTREKRAVIGVGVE